MEQWARINTQYHKYVLNYDIGNHVKNNHVDDHIKWTTTCRTKIKHNDFQWSIPILWMNFCGQHVVGDQPCKLPMINDNSENDFLYKYNFSKKKYNKTYIFFLSSSAVRQEYKNKHQKDKSTFDKIDLSKKM